MKIRAYHYTSKELEIGSVITSNQDKMQTYSLVHGIFKGVNPLLFDTYGYAYPEKRDKITARCYLVEADEDRVIKGDLRHSVYLCMEAKCGTDRKLPLAERLRKREEILRREAEVYFSPMDQEHTELISDRFIVVKEI
jgi:hypothetical protein